MNTNLMLLSDLLLAENNKLKETIKELQKELEIERNNNNNNNRTTPPFDAIKQQYITWGGIKG